MPATKYALDIYPAADPMGKVSGLETAAKLITMTIADQLLDAECITELYGMGSGWLEIHADHPDVQYLERHGYAQLNEVDEVGTSTPVSGFWLERGSMKDLSDTEDDGRVLRIEGEGPIYILSRYVLGHSIYATGQTARGDSPNIPHQWTWRAQPLGGILVRLLEEGTEHPDEFYKAITYDFDRDDDSNGNAWDEVEDYETKIGTNGLQLYADLQALGLVAWMDADLELHAYRKLSEMRTDRTSATFAANKVRFVAGVNIANNLPKRIWSTQERTHVLIKDRIGDYQTVDEDLDGNPIPSVPWMTYLESRTTADDAAIIKMGQLHLTRRFQQTDQGKIRFKLGPGGAGGAEGYTASPLADFWLGDLVTVDSGDTGYDFDEQAIEVAAIRYLVQDMDWMTEIEVGATYLRPDQDKLQRAFTSTIQQIIQHQASDFPLSISMGDRVSVLTTGIKGAIYFPKEVTIEGGWTALLDVSGSIQVDLWVGPYADYLSSITVADSICASDKIIVSSALKAQDAAPTGWIFLIPAGSVMVVNLDSVTSAKWAGITLNMKR